VSLEVDPAVLRSAGSAFAHAAHELAGLHVAAPLTGAASAVPGLQAAAACREAAADVAAEVAAVSESARRFDDDVQAAARWYESRDQAAAAVIEEIEFP